MGELVVHIKTLADSLGERRGRSSGSGGRRR
jgi:hypothetical protein